MTAPLYNTDILRLAASIPYAARLADPMASSDKRSVVCGSRVTVDVDLDDAGRVARVGLLVRACALGQAAAAVMAGHVVGRSVDELVTARDMLTAWLTGEGDVPEWPGIAIFAPAIPHSARHASIRLAFEAAAAAATTARVTLAEVR